MSLCVTLSDLKTSPKIDCTANFTAASYEISANWDAESVKISELSDVVSLKTQTSHDLQCMNRDLSTTYGYSWVTAIMTAELMTNRVKSFLDKCIATVENIL
jgi:hypothetical protein